MRHGYDLTLLNVLSDYSIKIVEIYPHFYHSYTPSFTDSNGSPGAPGTADTGFRIVGEAAGTRTVAFTNTRGPGVTITKTIPGASPNRTRQFIFDIYLMDLNNNLVQQGSLVEYTFTSLAAPPDPIYPSHGELNFGSNGMASVVLWHGYNMTLHLRENYRVRIVERDDPSYTTTFTDSGGGGGGLADTDYRTVTSSPRTFVFTNTRGPGITIAKTIPGANPDKYKDFLFNVTLRNQNQQLVPMGLLMEYSFTALAGPPDPLYEPTGNMNIGNNGIAAFPFRHGYNMTLYLRSDYTVQIAEILEANSNYIVSFTDSQGTPGAADTGPRLVGQVARTFTFTNTHNRGSITVSKMVAGIMANKTKQFNFTLHVATNEFGAIPVSNGTVPYTGGIVAGSGAVQPADGTLTLNAMGQAAFTLSHGQTMTFDLQGDWGFRVVETIDTHYSTTFTDSSGGLSGTFDTGFRPVGLTPKTIAYINTSSIVPTGIEDSSRNALAFITLAGMASISALTFSSIKKRRGRKAQHRSA
jgi:hypothetical protein